MPSTITTPANPETESPESKASPVETYRQAVDDFVTGKTVAEPSAAMAKSADVFPTDIAVDIETLRSRYAAIEQLKEADKLEREAVAIVVPTPEDFAARNPADAATIDELVSWIRGATGDTAVYVPAEKIRRHELLSEARSIRAASASALSGTSDSERFSRLAGPHHDRIQKLEFGIRERAKYGDLETRIGRTESRVNALATGEVPPELQHENKNARFLYGREKGFLRKLIAERPAADSAKKADETARVGIAEARKAIAKIDVQRRDPLRGMKWSD